MAIFQRCFSELTLRAFSKYTYWVSYPRYRAKCSYLSVKNSRAETWASAQFSPSVMSNSLWPYGLQNARLPCPSPTTRACSNSCPLSRWCHPIISSSVVPSSSCLQSFQHQGLFKWVSSSHKVAKVLEFQLQHQSFQWPSQDWFPLGLTGLIFLLSKGLSRVFPSTTLQKHQFLNAQPSLWYNTHIRTWLLEKP